MNRPILLRHLSNSSLAGQSREFRQDRVRLGRKPDNDVIFNPDQDRVVSGYHCEIVRDGDGLFVADPGSTNGTYVNGRRVEGRVSVTDRDQIMLGEQGPTVAVSFVDEAAAVAGDGPRTIVGAVLPPPLGLAPGAASGLLDVAANDLYARGPDGTGRPPVVAPPLPRQAYSLEVPSPQVYPSPGPPTPSALRPPHAPKSSIGFNTLMTELDRATKRERRRVVAMAVPAVAVVLVGGIGLALYLNRGDPRPLGTAVSLPPATAPAVAPAWATVLEPRGHSVYVVVNHKAGRADRGVGTAWSVAKGRLATNAHVAQAFNELGEGESLVARADGDPPKDLRIAAVALHPGYDEFDRLYKAHFPLNPSSGEQILYPTPYDVALMTVAEADVPAQAPPLELADADALHKVAEASDVAYVGYPMEQAVGGGVDLARPRPLKFPGTLSRKTDPFMGSVADERAIILQYQVPIQGGASGSPVFNLQGKVIGLVSGNDHAFLAGGQRIAIGGKGFGPRADGVRQLLDGTAAARTAAIAPEWRAFLRARFDEAAKAKLYAKRSQIFATNAFTLATQKQPQNPLSPAGKIVGLAHTGMVDLTAPGTAGAKDLTFQSAEDGYYAVVVLTDNPDMVPQVTVPAAEAKLAADGVPPAEVARTKEKALGQGQPATASFALRVPAGETLRYTVSAASREAVGTAKMTVVIVRATP